MISGYSSQGGFTLLEVLVAVAIVGAALGVFLSGLTQSHRQAYRANLVREAASIAGELIRQLKDEGFPPVDRSAVEGHEGWNYQVEKKELTVKIIAESGEERTLDATDMREVRLTLHPPQGAAPFVLTMWINTEETHR